MSRRRPSMRERSGWKPLSLGNPQSEPGRLYLCREDAEKAGHTRYLGDPCTRGHGGVRWTSNGECVTCKAELRTKLKREALPPLDHRDVDSVALERELRNALKEVWE